MKKYISNEEIESLFEAIVLDFFKTKKYKNVYCVDIETLVTEYLGLPIVYESFAEEDPGRIGFLSDGKHSVWITRNNERVHELFPESTIVIDKYLNNTREIGRKRFTIAHEGAHYILNKHIPAQTEYAYHSEFDSEILYDTSKINDMMSVNEALANKAAACLLMPKFMIDKAIRKYNEGKRIPAYDNYVLIQDNKIIVQKMANLFFMVIFTPSNPAKTIAIIPNV